MRISEVMTPNAVVTTTDARCCDAAKLMAEHDIGSVPVHESEKLVGMVTDRDITTRVTAKEHGPETPVSEAMSERVLYCREDDEVADVCRNMAEQAVRRLPVVDGDKRLVGMVSLGDLAEHGDDAAAGETLERIKEASSDARR
ncbi:MAG: CBS domain-containing protein [Oceanicaulis sp.]